MAPKLKIYEGWAAPNYLFGICVPHYPIVWNALIRVPSLYSRGTRNLLPWLPRTVVILVLPILSGPLKPKECLRGPFGYVWTLTFTTVLWLVAQREGSLLPNTHSGVSTWK